MRKVSDNFYSELDYDLSDLFKTGEDIKNLCENVNDQIKLILKTVTNDDDENLLSLIQMFNDKKESLKNRIDEIVDDQEGYYDDRSEKWQNTFNGESYYEWLESWRDTQSLIENACVETNFNGEIESEKLEIDVGVSDQFELPEANPETD